MKTSIIAGVSRGGSGVSSPADVTSRMGFGAGKSYTLRTNALPVTSDFTAISVHTATLESTSVIGRIWAKDTGGGAGWAISHIKSGTGRLRAGSGGSSALEYTYRPEDYGKVIIAFYTRTASRASLWIATDVDRTVREVAFDASPGAPVASGRGPMIGDFQLSTTGNGGGQVIQDTEVIGVAYASSALSVTQMNQIVADMYSNGELSAAIPSAVSVYNASTGLQTDVAGANDMQANGVTIDRVFTPQYPGKAFSTYVLSQSQSNGNGDQPAADFAAFATDYTQAFPACRLSVLGTPYIDLNDSGGVQGTAGEVFAGRDLVTRGIANPHIIKLAVHGSTIADWTPGTGPKGATGAGVRHAQLITLFDQIDAATDALDMIRVFSEMIDQGEAEAAAGAITSAAHQAGTAANVDGLKSLISDMGAKWVVDPSFIAALRLMSPTIQTGRDATNMQTIRDGQIALAASRADIVTIDPDPAGVVDDTVHFRAASLLGIGRSWIAGVLSEANQTMSEVQ